MDEAATALHTLMIYPVRAKLNAQTHGPIPNPNEFIYDSTVGPERADRGSEPTIRFSLHR